MIAVPLSDDLHADVHCISFEEVYGLAASFSHVDVWAHGGNGIPIQSVQWDIEAPADLLYLYMMHPPTDMQQKHCNLLATRTSCPVSSDRCVSALALRE